MIGSYNFSFHVQAFNVKNTSENSTRKIHATAKLYLKKEKLQSTSS